MPLPSSQHPQALPARRPRTRAALLPGLLLAAMAWLFRRPLLCGELFYERDMMRIFYPAKRYLAQRLAAGELPHWWPYDALGTPFLSSPLFSTFHPSTLLYLLLPFERAFTAQTLLAVPVAALGAFRLARAARCSAPFAWVAAAAYALNGYCLGVLEYTFTSWAVAALPFYLAAALRPARRALPRILESALALGLILLAGDPVVAVLAVLVGGALALGRTRQHLRAALALGAGTALGAALAAVQVLPALRLLPDSYRAAGLAAAEAEHWTLGASELLGFLVRLEHAPGEGGYVESMYLGVFTLALAALGLALRGPLRLRLGLVTLLSLLLAAGSATPLHGLFLQFVPMWKAFRYPVKAVLPAVLCLCLLAALGAQRLWQGLRRRRSALGPYAGLAFGVVLLELCLQQGASLPTTAPRLFAPPALVAPLRQAGIGLTGYAYNVFAAGPRDSIESNLEGYRHVAAALLPDLGALHGLPTTAQYMPTHGWRYQQLALDRHDVWLGRLSGAFGARAVITRDELVTPAQRQSSLLGHDAEHGLTALGLAHFLPRAYASFGARVLPRAQVVDYLRSGAFQPGREVVLEQEQGAPALPQSAEAPVAARRITREGDDVEVQVLLPRAGLLVLNESYFEGVSASEGGVALPVLPANHLARAVALGAGEHRVRFSYRAPGLAAGAGLSLAALGLLLALAALQVRRRRPAARA